MKLAHIKKSKEFAEVLENGGRTRGKALFFYLLPSSDKEELRVGTIVAKKFVRKAVRRNYIKRIIYTFFREHLADTQKGTRVVVRVARGLKAGGKKTIAQAVREDLDSLSRKNGIIQ